MKKEVIKSVGFFVMGLLVISLSGCGNSTENAVISIEDGQEKIIEISEQLMNGEITNEEANKLMEEVSESMESVESELKNAYDNISDFKSMPKWAKELGAYELKGFKMNKTESSVTEFSKDVGTPDGLSLVYSYDNEAEAIQVAEKLAADMGIKESNDSPRILQKNLDETMKSMIEYMSDEDKADYEKNKMSGYIAHESKGDYYVMVSVLNGDISLMINNIAQNEELMK